MATIDFSPLPPREAVNFFRAKGFVVGFNWQDVWQAEHASAFTVAKAMRLDILEDIRGAVDTALTEGVTFRQFKNNLSPILQAKGWWGKKTILDPQTGKMVAAQLGSARRLRIIFDTNMRMAHAAGRWERIQRVSKRRPWLRYVAVLDERTRQQHRQWHGTVLPVDDSWWGTHYPPNGWRCRCTVQQLSDRDLDRLGYAPTKRPPVKTRPWQNGRTGEIHRVPEGIDPGFGYNVGQARLRAFTPPPTGGLPRSFPPAVDLPDLPTPRPTDANRILPADLTEAEYVRRFLKEFNATPTRPVIFTDKIGENLIISEDLFRTSRGALKVSKDFRQPYLMLLADTIKSPDEIWWLWEESRTRPGTWLLRRRYIARWQIAGEQAAGVNVFEYGKNGWRGVTSFAPAPGKAGGQDRYLAGLRSGLLAWRRPE